MRSFHQDQINPDQEVTIHEMLVEIPINITMHVGL